MKRLYAKRNCEALCPEFMEHLNAMTAEALHTKSDIAAELAFRDRRIKELEERCDNLSWALNPEPGH